MTKDRRKLAPGVRDLTGVEVAGRYQVLGYLGEGTTGTVWRAQHLALGRECAIKILKDTGEADSQLAARFRREARAASRLDHPNIVFISDFGRVEDGQLYLVMEHISGPSLRELMEGSVGTVPRSRSLDILSQLAAAIDAAHEAGVVHRDIKPDNILLAQGEDGRDLVKVLDFSLARILDGANLTRLTRKGDLFGTPAYMAPEQVRSEPTGPATDIYSFGALAFELLTGRLPFNKPSIPSMMLAHREEAPPSPSSCLGPGVPPLPMALERLVLSCLEKRPELRPARGLDIVRLLDEIRHTERAPTSTYSIERLVAPSRFGEEESLRVSRRIWAREQAGKTAFEVAVRLRLQGRLPSQLGSAIRRIEELQRQLERIKGNVAILLSQRGDESRRERERLARLRYALAELSEERGALVESSAADEERLADLDFQLAELERALAVALGESEAGEAGGRMELQEMKSREASLRERQLEASRELALILRAHPELVPADPEARTEFDDLVALLGLAEAL
ncbi:MAG: protein kinase [Polyangia bacterium]|jgi:serine/threonine protein kinase|nr:protein kinase [Polyangia bacterium]